MFLRIPTKKSMKNYSDEIIHLKEKLDKADAVVIGAVQGFQLRLVLLMQANALKNIFLILSRNTALQICIRADFTHLKHLKNTGRIGADTSTSTAIWIYRIIYMI